MSQQAASARRMVALAALTLVIVALGPAIGKVGLTNGSETGYGEPRAVGGGRVLAAPDLSAPHAPDQLLVKLSAKALEALSQGDAQAGAALAAAGATRVLNTIPQLGLAVVETVPGADLAGAAADLAASPAVEWAEPNYIFALDFTPNDPYYASNQTPYPLGLVQMPAAWDYTIGQPEVVIAILDTGVDMDHPDLSSGIWTNPREIPNNGIDDDGNGFVDDVHGWDFAANDNIPDDDYGHGTHVAGIAAARINNGKGIAGMAGQATIMPVDVFQGGIGTYDSLIRAMVYATDNGAQVINMSLGASSFSRGEEAAVDYAWSHGVLLVGSAGNSGRNTYNYPAAHANVIAVAATNSSDQRASFSTYADFVDVAAPGSSILSTYPGGSYGTLSGTSMAAPHVSGLAALVLSLNPDLTPDTVRELIEQNADDLGASGWDPYFGYGRINGQRTLTRVAPNPSPTPSPTPGPPLEIWPSGCVDLIPDGDFETGLGEWLTSGSVNVTNTLAYSGTKSITFAGAPNSRGAITRTLELPPFPMGGTLWFAYRIYGNDGGYGTTPSFPYDDWLTAEFRTEDGQLLESVLRTGNSADTASDGLPWDRFLYRMQPVDFTSLGATGPINLVFTTGNDGDSQPTDFWVDAVRFCVAGTDTPSLPDLVASELAGTGVGCSVGSSSGVKFRVENRGQADAANFYVRVSTEGAFNEWHVTSLEAGAWQEFSWSGVPGLRTYTGTVDERNMLLEPDEANNQLSREVWVEDACTPTPTSTATPTITPTPTGTPTPDPKPYRVILMLISKDAPAPWR